MTSDKDFAQSIFNKMEGTWQTDVEASDFSQAPFIPTFDKEVSTPLAFGLGIEAQIHRIFQTADGSTMELHLRSYLTFDEPRNEMLYFYYTSMGTSNSLSVEILSANQFKTVEKNGDLTNTSIFSYEKDHYVVDYTTSSKGEIVMAIRSVVRRIDS